MGRCVIMRIGAVCTIAALCTVMTLAGAAERKAGLVVHGDGVWLPSYDDNGQLKSQILGDSMAMVDDNIEVSGLVMEILTNDVVDVRISSEKCLYLPKKNEIRSSYTVRLERTNLGRTNMVITGRGFAWRESKAQVKILKDVRVRVHDIQSWLSEPGDAVAADDEPTTRDVETTIAADRLVFRYEERVGFFDGYAKATDGKMTISADTMMVVFNKDNTAKTLEAVGSVMIAQGAMTSRCDRAFCNIDGEQILLDGNAEAVRGNEIARGDKIILLPKHDRIICQPGYLKVDSFDDVERLVDGEREPTRVED